MERMDNYQMPALKNQSFWSVLTICFYQAYRGLFRTQPNIYEGAFWENS